MKKIKLLFICVLFGLIMLPIVSINAQFSEIDVVKTCEEVTNKDLGAGVKLYQYETSAYNDGIIDESRINDYVVSWLDYGTNKNVRIVNYCQTLKNNFSVGAATELARKYEKENPGYLVIGAVNGDFFRINDSGEVKNLSVKEGEVYKPYIWQGTGLGVIGWTYDGKIIDGTPSISNNMYLETLDEEENIISEIEIANVNNGIKDAGISIITKDVDVEGGTKYDLSGCTVVEIAYDIHRYSMDGYSATGTNEGNILFVKGHVINVYKDLTNEEIIPDGSCYLVAKDDSLNNVKVDDYLRCQYHLTGDWSEVYNTTGYYAKILTNGESLFYQSSKNDYSHLEADTSYINCKKNRTVIGERADGSTVLMTIEYNKSGNYGASYYECAEYLKSVGCVNGWLLDGGGSTTMAIKNENGSFEMIAGGSDGHERRNGNAILLVVKDPGITSKVTNISRFSAELDIMDTESMFRENTFDITLSVNGVTKEYNGTPIAFDNLEEATSYQVAIGYKMREDDGSITESTIYRSFKTLSFNAPNIKISVAHKSNDAVVFKKEVKSSLEGLTLTNLKIHIGDNEYFFNDDIRALCDGLKASKLYEAYITYDVYEELTGNTYHITGEKVVFSTEKTSSPLITCFKLINHQGTNVTFEYGYYDPSNKVTDVYVKYGTDLMRVTSTNGEITIPDIDVRTGAYSFGFVIEFEGRYVETESIILLQSEQLPGDNNQDNDNINNDQNVEESKSGCKCGKDQSIILISLLSCMTLLYIFKKKH